ncbi:apomucin-like [Pelmatolapia mariae]|uniref:apomucin-like n=1 Tax=Pelmatolapia mariae TaxID=158779 RepID=UPI003211D58E
MSTSAITEKSLTSTTSSLLTATASSATTKTCTSKVVETISTTTPAAVTMATSAITEKSLTSTTSSLLTPTASSATTKTWSLNPNTTLVSSGTLSTTLATTSTPTTREMSIEKTCSYNEQTYKAGDKWTDPAHPCKSFSCSKEGIQTETKVCPKESCPEEDRIWDDQHCCYTCKRGCVPRVSSFNITIENCSTVIQIPACQGQCSSQLRVLVLNGDLILQQERKCCVEQNSERKSMTLHCSDLTTRQYAYKHITSCVCESCSRI